MLLSLCIVSGVSGVSGVSMYITSTPSLRSESLALVKSVLQTIKLLPERSLIEGHTSPPDFKSEHLDIRTHKSITIFITDSMIHLNHLNINRLDRKNRFSVRKKI